MATIDQGDIRPDPEARRLLAHTEEQRPESLQVGDRGAGGAGREDAGRELRPLDLGHQAHGRVRGGLACRVAHLRQPDLAVRRVGEADRIGGEGLQLADHLRGMGRGQEAHLAGREAGGEPHGEVVAVGAGIEHVPALAEQRLHAADVVQELARGEGCTGAVGHHRVGRGVP